MNPVGYRLVLSQTPPRTSGCASLINCTHFVRRSYHRGLYRQIRGFSSNMSRMSNGTSGYKKVLSIDNINPAVVDAKYAVRGELALRANALTEQLKKEGQGSLPFNDVVHCEIGNPQALDQKPLTFIRQVLAMMEYPDLLAEDKLSITKQLFPSDAIDRARS